MAEITIERSGLGGTMIAIRKYRDSDRDALIAILKQNVPRYFAESDIPAFDEYLRKRQWDRCYVYLGATGRVIGCAGVYLKSPEVVGLSYALFEPSTVGSGAIRAELARYLTSATAKLRPSGKPTLVLNTTPRVARLMRRFGFVVTATVPAGYAEGYDMVHMERRLGAQTGRGNATAHGPRKR
jgi:[ribosomal protein S18]-alanine N-acetyltransferase